MKSQLQILSRRLRSAGKGSLPRKCIYNLWQWLEYHLIIGCTDAIARTKNWELLGYFEEIREVTTEVTKGIRSSSSKSSSSKSALSLGGGGGSSGSGSKENNSSVNGLGNDGSSTSVTGSSSSSGGEDAAGIRDGDSDANNDTATDQTVDDATGENKEGY
jgi:hypothetical protein